MFDEYINTVIAGGENENCIYFYIRFRFGNEFDRKRGKINRRLLMSTRQCSLGGTKVKRKCIVMFLIVSLFFSVGNIQEKANAKTQQEMTNREDRSIQLSKVVAGVEYPEAVTDEQDWKVNKKDKYEFPINCEKRQWSQYKTHNEMLEACTVPDEILENATTEQLLDMVLDYPLLCDIYAFDTVEQGVAVVASQFNGFAELIKREDLSDVVLERYIDADIQNGTKNLKENFNKVSAVVVMEDLLAQKDMISDLTLKEKEELANAIEEKTVEKKDRNIFYGNVTTFYDIAAKNGVKEELGLKDTKDLVHDEEQASSNKGTVKTPKGTKVTVYKYTYKGKSWADSVTNRYVKAYPHAKKLGDADNRYNCHSYAWYSASTSNRYWMNSPKPYVEDGSYKCIGNSPTAVGQKVVYKDQSYVPMDNWIHSGITVNTSSIIKSKWGQGPLMQHGILYSPYNGQFTTIDYYKKK